MQPIIDMKGKTFWQKVRFHWRRITGRKRGATRVKCARQKSKADLIFDAALNEKAPF